MSKYCKFGIAILCVVIIVTGCSMSNKGIEGTWKGEAKNRDRETDGRWLYTIKFNEDNAGYLIWETPDAKLKAKDYLIEWRKVDENKFVITCPETSDEIFIEPDGNEFVVESSFCAVEQNTVFHREQRMKSKTKNKFLYEEESENIFKTEKTGNILEPRFDKISIAKYFQVVEVEMPTNHVYSYRKYLKKYKIHGDFTGIEARVVIKNGKVHRIYLSS